MERVRDPFQNQEWSNIHSAWVDTHSEVDQLPTVVKRIDKHTGKIAGFIVITMSRNQLGEPTGLKAAQIDVNSSLEDLVTRTGTECSEPLEQYISAGVNSYYRSLPYEDEPRTDFEFRMRFGPGIDRIIQLGRQELAQREVKQPQEM